MTDKLKNLLPLPCYMGMSCEHYKGQNARAEVEESGSAGEKQIARMLNHYQVRFFYEHPVAVLDREKVRVWYPDFWLPDYGVAIEYAGVKGNEDYDAGIDHKKEVYRASGVSCLFVDVQDLRGGWPKRLLWNIRCVLAARMAEFDSLETRLRHVRE